ncbi:hypothetical protein ACC684_11660 [Rhizobium ruizarguesonis]
MRPGHPVQQLQRSQSAHRPCRMRSADPEIKRAGGIAVVKPKLIAEIEYRAWTDDEKLRHASYKGLRDEADDETVLEL